MRTFTIDPDNNITALVDVPAGAANVPTFSTEKDLTKLTIDWPVSRLIDTWNSFAGVAPFDELKPVKKFTDRKSAVARIWKAVERLLPQTEKKASRATDVASGSVKPPVTSSKRKRRDTARAVPTGSANVARDGSKKAEVIELMHRTKGITLAEIMKLTGWQAHTVRGFVSGTLVKKLGLSVESFRTDQKERAYKIKS